MARWMALDMGIQRIGVAITDPLGMFAQPYDCVSPTDLPAFVQQFHQKEGIRGLIIGQPLHLDGQMNDLETFIVKQIEIIRKILPDVEIHRIDERFTSSMAGQAMHLGGAAKKQKKQKENVDKVAAAILLQSWLERMGG